MIRQIRCRLVRQVAVASAVIGIALLGQADTVVTSGEEELDHPGETVNLGTIVVGDKSVEASPTLELKAGDFYTLGELYIQRGSGSLAAPQTATLKIDKDASLTVGNMRTGTHNGNPNHYSSSKVEIDGGLLKVGTARLAGGALNNGMGYHSENNGNAVIEVKNGGQFIVDSVYYTQTGFYMGYNANALSTPRLEVNTGATAGMHALFLREGATVDVDRATFQLNRTMDQRYNTAPMGDAFFNGSTLTYYSNLLRFDAFNFAGQAVEWFNGARVHVGADGLTMAIPGHARLEGQLLAAEGAERTASVNVTGNGTLQADLFGTTVPVNPSETVELKASRKTPAWTDALGEVTIDQQAGRPFAFAGHGALAQGTLHPTTSGLTGRLEATAGNFVRDEWKLRDWAQIYDDGVLLLGQVGGYHAAAAWKREKLDVTRSFTLHFTLAYANVARVDNTSSGMMAVWQNSAAGLDAIGGNNASDNGYFNGNTAMEHSFGVGVRGNGYYCFGKDKTRAYGNDVAAGFTATQLGATPDKRLYVTVTYDADKKEVEISSYLDATKTRTSAKQTGIDLVEITGADTAYFGFTGVSNFSCDGQQFVSECSLVYADEETPSVLPHLGGTLALDAGMDYTVVVRGNAIQRGGVLGELSYGDGAKLTVANEGIEADLSANIPGLEEIPSSLNADDWDYFEFAYGPTEERPGLSPGSAAGRGGFASKAELPVTTDWSLSFDLHYETSQSTVNEVDYLYFALSTDDFTYQENYTKFLDLIFQHNKADGFHNEFLRFNNGTINPATGALLTNVSFLRDEKIHFDWSYSASAKQLTVKMTQVAEGEQVSDTAVFNTGNNLTTTYFPSGTARFMCRTFGGESNRPKRWIENFAFSSPAIETKAAFVGKVSVGFDKLVPTEPGATVEKLGKGALVVTEPGSEKAQVKLSEGRLVLKKTALEPLTADYDHGGWTFSDETGTWGAHRGLKLNSTKANNANNAVTVGRKAVSGNWRASFKVNLVGQTTPGDAFSFFVQNDPNGPHQLGGGNAWAAWTGAHGLALGWNVYPSGTNNGRLAIARNTGFNYTVDGVNCVSHKDVLTLANAMTDVTLTHDAAAKTLKVDLSQGADKTFTHTFENVDIRSYVGGDLAYLGFGTGGGGAHALPEFVDFRFEQLSGDDPTALLTWLGGVELTEAVNGLAIDTPLAEAQVRVGSVKVPAGVTFAPTSESARGVIAIDMLVGSGAVEIDTTKADVKVSAVDEAVTSLVVKGPGKIILPAGETLKGCDICLLGEASIEVLGKTTVHSVFVNDIKQKKGVYTDGDAAWLEAPSGARLRTVDPLCGFTITIR